ncbi:MAG: trigger factor [Dehalococcoidia bacterium]
MKVTKEKEENRQAYLTVEIESGEMEEALEDAYRKLSKRVEIPGFRKGKAPRAIVERNIGRERLVEEAVNKLVPQAYEQALKEHEIEPYAQPEIELTQAEPVIFKAVVPLIPTVKLGDYKSIRMTPEKVNVTKDKTDSVLEELRHQYATWETVERPLEYNDLAVIDINGKVEEKPYVEKIGAQYQVVKENISPAPGFAEQIVGMKKDEEKEFTLSFPEDYPNKEVAGKEGGFKVKLTEIKEEKLPKLNDELAAQISPEFNTIKSLRDETQKRLKENAEEQARMDFEEKVINAAIEQSKTEYPPVVIELEIDRIISEQNRRLQMSGRGMDDYLQSVGKTGEELREELRPVSVTNVNASLVINKITQEEKIEVSEEDIDKRIDEMTQNTQEENREQLRSLFNNPETRQSVKQTLITRKTIEKLVEIAKTKPKPVKQSKEETKEETK